MDDDAKPLTGAQFARQVGIDPQKWAQRFLHAAALNTSWTDADRLAFTAAWFRDAMDAAVKAARRERDDLQKVGVWKPGDALDDEGRSEYPPGPPR